MRVHLITQPTEIGMATSKIKKSQLQVFSFTAPTVSSVSTNGIYQQDIDITTPGYEAIGIAGFNLQGSNVSRLSTYQSFLLNSETVRFRACNTTSTSASNVYVVVSVLFREV